MSIFKWQLSSSSIFVSFFIVMTHITLHFHDTYHFSLSWHITPLSILSSYIFYFGQNNPIKVPFLTLSSLWWKFPKFLMSFSKRKVTFSSNFASLFIVMKDNSSVLFLAQTIHTLPKRSTLKWKFWDFQVLRSKFLKFLMSILKWKDHFSSNFAVFFFIVMTHNSSVDFKLILFLPWLKGSHHQSPNFEVFKCSGENFPYLMSFS